jgi:hypothetical protein
MEDYKNDAGLSQRTRDTMECIIDRKYFSDDISVCFFDPSTKCNDPWDEVIGDIINKTNSDDKLDCAYVRIGEDTDDMEMRNGDKCLVHMYIERTISDVDYDNFEDDIVTPPPVTARSASATEQCGNCGKIKDSGQKCWWCGTQ